MLDKNTAYFCKTALAEVEKAHLKAGYRAASRPVYDDVHIRGTAY